MRVDDAQFNQGLDGAKSRFDGLKSAVGSGVKAIATGFAAATTATAGLGVAAFKVGLDYNRLQQSSRAALTTLLGGAEAANAQMDKLDEFARSSPFAKQVFIEAQQQLIGFGMAAGDVLPTLDAIQNAVAAVGGSNQDISEVTRVLAQVISSGKITAETFNQLGARGIDAATLIGDSMGKTGAQIRDAVTKGSIDAGDAVKALTDGMMARFGGATDLIKEQMDGAADRVKGAFRDIGSAMAAPFVDPNGGGYLVVWTNEVADAMRAAERKIRPLVDLLVARFGPGLATVSPLLIAVKETIDAWDLSKVNAQLDALGQYTPIITGVATAMFALGTSSLPIIGGINPLVAGFAALAATSPEVRRMLGDFASSLSPLLPLLGDLAVVLGDTAMLVLRELAPAVAELLVAGGDLAVTLGGSLIPAFADLLLAGAPLVPILADVVRWVADLPGPLLIAAGAFIAMQGPLKPVADGIAAVAAGFVRIIQQAQVQAVLGNTNVAMGGLAGTSARAAAGIGALGGALRGAFLASGVGIAIAGVVAALGSFFTAQAEAKRHVDELSGSLDRQTGSLTENTRELVYNRLEQDGVVKAAVRAGIGLNDLVDAAMDPASDAAVRLRERVAEANDEISRAHEEGPQNTSAIAALRDKYEDLWLVSREVSSEQESMASAEQKARLEREAGIGVTEGATEATNAHREAQARLREELEEGIDATLNAAEAQLRMEDSMLRATEAVEAKRDADAELEKVLADSSSTEEERTKATRDAERANRDAERAVLDVIKATNDNIAAIGRNNGSYEDMRAEMSRARESFIEQRIQMGDTRAEAERLADQYGLIPSRVDTMVHLSGVEDAMSRIRTLDNTLNTINGKTVTANVAVRQYGQAAIASGGYVGDFARALGYAHGGTPKRFPHGGQALGPGTSTSDEIAAWLSNTEFVQRGAAVQKYGLPFMHAVNSLQFPVELARPFRLGGSPASPATAVAPAAGATGVSVSLAGTHVVLRVGEREVVGYLEEIADGRIEEKSRRQRAWAGSV